jgi:AcrR family transcriptional regulator
MTAPKPTPPRPTYHHGDLRAELLRAAEAIVIEKGAAAVTMREVARRAGVSLGAPFYHFPTRKALMTALAEETNRDLRASIESLLRDTTDPATRLRALAQAWVTNVMRKPAQFQVIADRMLIDPSELIKANTTEMRAVLRQSLHAAGARGPDLDLAVLGLRAAAYGLARMYVDGHWPEWGDPTMTPEQNMIAVLNWFTRNLFPAIHETPRKPQRPTARKPKL